MGGVVTCRAHGLCLSKLAGLGSQVSVEGLGFLRVLRWVEVREPNPSHLFSPTFLILIFR